MCLAVPGKIVSTSGDDPWTRTAKVSFGGVIKEVNLAYVPDVKVDDYVIVHAGFALSQIDEAEAIRMFEDLSMLAEHMGDEDVITSGGEIPPGGAITAIPSGGISETEIPPEGISKTEVFPERPIREPGA
jgi:hydrogenase expression/formation protein HypC